MKFRKIFLMKIHKEKNEWTKNKKNVKRNTVCFWFDEKFKKRVETDTESKTGENQTETHVCQILRCKTKTDVKGETKNVKWTTQTLALFLCFLFLYMKIVFLGGKRRKFCMAQNDQHNSTKDSVCMWCGKWWKICLKIKKTTQMRSNENHKFFSLFFFLAQIMLKETRNEKKMKQ